MKKVICFAVVVFCFCLCSPDLKAQNQVDVLVTCITVSNPSASQYQLVNGCGVSIHASWGFWSTPDSGSLSYAIDLNPGQAVNVGMVLGNHIFAMGCPSTPMPGKPYGYKLTYRNSLGSTVVNWKDTNTLVCLGM
jgi:hypothetical protein